MELRNIIDDCGLQVNGIESLHGGDINRAYCIHTSDAKYFLKVNDAVNYPGMFEKEARGLDALRNNAPGIIIPRVIKYGHIYQQQWLLLEWLEKRNPTSGFWENFGSALAQLHKQPQTYFGWLEDNYIGSLVQQNTISPSWHLFYVECRIMPLIKRLFDANQFSRKDVKDAENLCNKLEQLFPAEPPSLVHGDLWSGNFMVTANGNAALYDPAVYCGHREMDIGMTKLFGGFDQRFYAAYHQAYPLETGWQQRLPLTQLYPLLIHAVLFGGHYINSANQILLSYA